jgi:hypothetical protein
MIRPVAGAALAVLPAAAAAHAFDDRYDLPLPLGYFIAGAVAAVALSFVIAALVLRRPPPAAADFGPVVPLGPVLPLLRALAQLVGVALLALVLAAGFFGSGNPLANVAPTLVWIIAWTGLTLLVACVGDVWTALDPWRAVFERLDAWALRSGRPGGLALGWRYPEALGAWPATALLLGVGWFELVDPAAADPRHIAAVLAGWSAVTLAGMAGFGREAWQRNADVLAVYFATLGRFAPCGAGPDRRSLRLRLPGRGLLWPPAPSTAMAGFVVAMLATVLFDGILGAPLWSAIDGPVRSATGAGGMLTATCGLVATWLALWAALRAACGATARLAGDRSAVAVERTFALSLVPIAVGYAVAHNASNLLVQGQRIIALASDPLGRQWDLFGTAGYRIDIGVMDARLTWYVALAAIVAGHVVATWLAHRIALRQYGSAARAVRASIPLTALMLVYTAVSLLVIAEPLVRFAGP